jgi:anti-sigma B factor antagonist
MLAQELMLQQDGQAERQTLRVGGELDMATAPDLVATVAQVLAQGAPSIVVDIRGLTFMDSTGLRGVLTIRDLCMKHSCELTLTEGQRQVQRVFEVAGVDHALPFRDSSSGDHHRDSYQRKRRRFAESMTHQYLRRVGA